MRALLVAVLIALPSLMVDQGAQEASQIILLIALVAGLLVFAEYSAHSPSILEFRFAAPYNRIKFIALAIIIVTLSAIARGGSEPGSLTLLLADFGRSVGTSLDFPYSPVRQVLLLVPTNAPAEVIEFVRIAAGLSYGASLLILALFVLIVRVLGWPVRRGAFNVWMNLPLFDPTRGGDVVQKLQREAGINLSLGFVLPFLLPVIVAVMQGLLTSSSVLQSHTLIWMIVGWAFLPASLVMRGIAMIRVAELISAKRRRAYAQAEDSLQVV
ncbi:hypothetical protein ACEWPM_011130 [Roseovarius sp. S4756]|uniref:hypothetical protein n=1 Tax=Roseovarius maritimus TaxID=3342637 RepID=UPI00372BBCD2